MIVSHLQVNRDIVSVRVDFDGKNWNVFFARKNGYIKFLSRLYLLQDSNEEDSFCCMTTQSVVDEQEYKQYSDLIKYDALVSLF